MHFWTNEILNSRLSDICKKTELDIASSYSISLNGTNSVQ